MHAANEKRLTDNPYIPKWGALEPNPACDVWLYNFYVSLACKAIMRPLKKDDVYALYQRTVKEMQVERNKQRTDRAIERLSDTVADALERRPV